MGKGKNLILIGGIVSLIGTFLFTWYQFSYETVQYANGIGGIINFINLIIPSNFYVQRLELERWQIQVIAILMLLFLISGILQLIGKKNRKVGLLGTIMPLLMGIALVLGGTISLFGFFLRYFEIYGTSDYLIEGVIPFHIVVVGRAALGSFIVLAGGVLGLIGVLVSKEEFY
ncbi:MAG: hypothetical protein ACFFDK_15130 [Promethearchaeota archaeon]